MDITRLGAGNRATTPSMAVEAEAVRQTIREKYVALQTAIDDAFDVFGLTALVEPLL